MTKEELVQEIHRQLGLKSEVTAIGPPYVALKGEDILAALFISATGPYWGYKGIDAWDELRDAKRYNGPYRVVAHPPCERWGRYWSGGPSAKVRRKLGDDNGCFKSALKSVRLWGGVIEHPEASHAFRVFKLGKPPRSGGWVRSDDGIGWICCVEQGHYGHPARKATWLYYVGKEKPFELRWGPSKGQRLDEGFHSTEERRAARTRGQKPIRRLTEREKIHTPFEFMKVMIGLARA